jgi:hypothetical protein
MVNKVVKVVNKVVKVFNHDFSTNHGLLVYIDWLATVFLHNITLKCGDITGQRKPYVVALSTITFSIVVTRVYTIRVLLHHVALSTVTFSIVVTRVYTIRVLLHHVVTRVYTIRVLLHHVVTSVYTIRVLLHHVVTREYTIRVLLHHVDNKSCTQRVTNILLYKTFTILNFIILLWY